MGSHHGCFVLSREFKTCGAQSPYAWGATLSMQLRLRLSTLLVAALVVETNTARGPNHA